MANALVDKARGILHDVLRNPAIDKYASLIEQKTSVPRETAALVVLGVLAAYLIIGGLAQFLCNLIGFGYPAYASVQAIRSKEKVDDTQWLTYWTVFAVFSLADSFAVPILSYFPIYYLAKAIFLVYLFLPQTMGAQRLYVDFVDPLFTRIEQRLGSGGGKRE